MPDNNFYYNQNPTGGEQTPPVGNPQYVNPQVNNPVNQNFNGYYPPYNGQYNNAPYVSYIPFGYTPKTYNERKGIRKAANLSAAAFLVVTFFITLWSILATFVMYYLGFTQSQINEIFSEPGNMQIIQIVLSSFLFTVPFVVIFKMGKYRISDLIPLGKPDKRLIFPLLAIGISFCSFANIAVNYASSFFEFFGIDYNVDYGENPQGFFGFILSLIATVFVPAFVEEFACRGIVLGSLKKYGESFAIVASSILFGVMHGNFEQIPFAFLVGLVLGYIAIKSNTMWLSVIVHAFNNFISVFFTYVMNVFPTDVQNIIYVCYLSLTLVLGIFGVLILKNRMPDFFKFNKSDTEADEGKKAKWFYTSPTVIIFFVITFLESLLYLV